MNLLIIGAGGHGRVALDIFRSQPRGRGAIRVVGFLDADESLAGTKVDGVPVLGGMNLLPKLKKTKSVAAFVAIGDNRARLSCMGDARRAGVSLVNAIHPRSTVAASAALGENVMLAAGAIACAGSTVGDGVILNTAASIDHECTLDAGVHVCPTACLAGRVRVGEGAFVGLGAKLIQCLNVGAWSTIGAGAVVIHDVGPGATVVGVPARSILATNRRVA
jgi:sugar O-acyltransferase (sialic acid O-acetyltransferase NeuD family)